MRLPILPALIAIPLLFGVGVLQVALTEAAGSSPSNVMLSRFRTEPTVAVDPTNPSVVVVSSNTDYIHQPNGTFPAPFFSSRDGGRSFNVGTLPLPDPYTTGADTSVAIARDGTVFYSYLAESSTYCSSGPGAVLLAHSVDHGLSFRGPTVVDSNPNDDRPTMTVESVSGQPSHLFVSWTRSFSDHSEIWFARSVDGGATFTPAGMLYSSALTNFGAEPVVGPQGHVYVVWLSQANVAPTADGAAQVLFTASTDDGAHFGPVRGAGRGFTTLPQLAQPGSLRDLTTPTAAAAPDGTVYVAYAAVRDRHPNGAVDADIWLTRSVDQGATWSQPQRVNDVRTGDRFMPALRVLADGSLGVAFYDRRASPDELDVYAAHVAFVAAPSAPASRTATSTHLRAGGNATAGPRFEMTANVRVNSAPSPVANIAVFNKSNSCFPPGRFFGDYIGAATDGTALDVVWTGPRPRQSKETDLWFARVALPAFVTTRPRASVVPSPTTSGGSIFFRVPRKIVALVKRAAGFVPISNASGPLLIPVIVILLLPILAVTIAFRTLREARGS